MRGSGGGCGFNSFPADTLVHTEQGLKPIQDIQVGDKVLALDERTRQTSYQPVLQLIQNKGQYQFIKVTLENGEQLEATAEHPFYIQGKGWNAAANLKVGDALLLHNGTTLVVKTLDTSVRVDAVYNFTVANLHNYFVGKDGVVVHNVKCKHFDNFDDAREDAFQQAGMTNPEDVGFSKSDPKTGTTVEFTGPDGAKVAYDSPHADMDMSQGHDKPHVGWQTSGKKRKAGGLRGNNTYDGPQHPYR